MAGAGLLTGCGSYDNKAGKIAAKYINEKYGIKAKASKVHISEKGWLEFSFTPPSSARVLMKYEDKEFQVFVPFESGVSGCTDNYEMDKITGEIRDYIESCLVCDKIAFNISYGYGYGQCMLTADIRSAEQLAEIDRTDAFINVFVSGLDPESINNIDTMKYGDKMKFGIAVCTDRSSA